MSNTRRKHRSTKTKEFLYNESLTTQVKEYDADGEDRDDLFTSASPTASAKNSPTTVIKNTHTKTNASILDTDSDSEEDFALSPSANSSPSSTKASLWARLFPGKNNFTQLTDEKVSLKSEKSTKTAETTQRLRKPGYTNC